MLQLNVCTFGQHCTKQMVERTVTSGCVLQEVIQQVWAHTALLPDGAKAHVQASCIVAREAEPSEGENPIKWRLLTNLPVARLGAVGRCGHEDSPEWA